MILIGIGWNRTGLQRLARSRRFWASTEFSHMSHLLKAPLLCFPNEKRILETYIEKPRLSQHQNSGGGVLSLLFEI